MVSSFRTTALTATTAAGTIDPIAPAILVPVAPTSEHVDVKPMMEQSSVVFGVVLNVVAMKFGVVSNEHFFFLSFFFSVSA